MPAQSKGAQDTRQAKSAAVGTLREISAAGLSLAALESPILRGICVFGAEIAPLRHVSGQAPGGVHPEAAQKGCRQANEGEQEKQKGDWVFAF